MNHLYIFQISKKKLLLAWYKQSCCWVRKWTTWKLVQSFSVCVGFSLVEEAFHLVTLHWVGGGCQWPAFAAAWLNLLNLWTGDVIVRSYFINSSQAKLSSFNILICWNYFYGQRHRVIYLCSLCSNSNILWIWRMERK